jgi:putative ABC transport system permease protein
MKPDRFYSILLKLYPAAFREEYEREMRASFRRQRREEPGFGRGMLLWLSILADTLTTAPGEHFHMLMSDVRYGLRTLRKTPAFTLAVLTTIALGIGATTAIYSLVHTVLLRPLPFADPDRMIKVWDTNKSLNITEFASSVMNFLSWHEQSQNFEALAAIRSGSANLTGDGEPQRVVGNAVSTDFFITTGIVPIAGRVFSSEENIPGKDGVAMISEGLWRQRYAADSSLLGRTILVNGIPRVVVGIMPQDVGYTSRIDLWTPLAVNLAQEERGNHVVTVIGKLRRGTSLAAAETELNAIAVKLEKEFPTSNAGWRVRLVTAKQWIVDEDSRASLYVLLAAVGLLLLATCANVAGLLVTRATARAPEFGVRLALGAGRGRLIRQLTTESLLLALIGGGVGILIAVGAVQWLAPRVTNQLPRSTNLSVDWHVLAFALVLTVSIGVLFGLAPAWSARRADVSTALRSGGRGTSGSAGTRIRLALVGAQVAIATVLVIGALLLVQSLSRLQKADLGFQSDHVLTASINLPLAKYATQDKGAAFYADLLSQIEALPGVLSVGLTSGVPMIGGGTGMPVSLVERSVTVPEQGIQAAWRMVDAGYFRTMRIPLKRGRLFGSSDLKSSPIVLSERLSRQLWPEGSDPIGRQVKLANGQIRTVTGIVGDVIMVDRRQTLEPAMYFPPAFLSTLTLTVRTASDPAQLTRTLRETVQRIDPAQPVFNVRTMDAILEADTARSRLQTTLLVSFASLALFLGAVGIAGVVAYSIERRTPELALRLALGATPAAAMRAAANGGLNASILGLVVGLIGAWGLSRSLGTVLYKVRPDDPLTFAGVSIVLLGVAAAACWLPARRATRIDPAVALKQE